LVLQAYTLFEYADTAPESGQVLIKFLEVTGMGHAWSGGSSSGTYADPKGPDARHHLPRACLLLPS
jgi:poly(3-hydroxybutyrate) depolymerase